ncbi:MAG: glycosyltransferase [Bacteroidales bacterium]|nr:glycosyltransferase [Bacteroidales bacterium]
MKFAKFLPEFDWEPIILTVDPASASYPVLDESLLYEIPGSTRIFRTRSKEWFSVYKKVSGDDKIPYAGFANEKKTSSFKQKFARFIRGNFFIPDPRKGWNKYALDQARDLLKKEKIDSIITSSPPHSTQLIGLTLSKEFGIPWIADLRDPWTDIYYYKQFYPTWLAHRYNLKLEKTILEKSSVAITVSPALKNLFAEKIKSSPDKIKVITNGFDPDDFQDLPSAPSNKKFVITYVGTMADIYPLEPFLKAFKSFAESHKGAVLRFIGTVSPEHIKRIKRIPKENIELIPYVDHRRAIEYMSSSSALLLIIPSNKNNKGIITGKLFEYMAVKRPILLLGPVDGDAASIINKGKSGIAIESDKEKEILKTMNKWVKENHKLEANSKYSRRSLTQKLSEILDEITS